MRDLPVNMFPTVYNLVFFGGKRTCFSPAHLLRLLRGGGLQAPGGRAQVRLGHPKVTVREDTHEGPEEGA